MNILVVGAGGVGAAVGSIAARRSFFDRFVLADYDETRAMNAVTKIDDGRFEAAHIDASSATAVTELARRVDADVVLNACDPRLNPAIFDGTFAAGCTYLD